MSDSIAVPTGSLPRTVALPIFQGLVSGATDDDATKFFSQLKALKGHTEMVPSSDGMGFMRVEAGFPKLLVSVLIANDSGAALHQEGDVYVEHGDCYAVPRDQVIPAATADEITYGVYLFGDVLRFPVDLTAGVLSIKSSGTTLPAGLAIGWRASSDGKTLACNVAVESVAHVAEWCTKHVDASSGRHATVQGQATTVACRIFKTETSGHFTLAALVSNVTSR